MAQYLLHVLASSPKPWRMPKTRGASVSDGDGSSRINLSFDGIFPL
jgi:hypothetical protein